MAFEELVLVQYERIQLKLDVLRGAALYFLRNIFSRRPVIAISRRALFLVVRVLIDPVHQKILDFIKVLLLAWALCLAATLFVVLQLLLLLP